MSDEMAAEMAAEASTRSSSPECLTTLADPENPDTEIIGGLTSSEDLSDISQAPETDDMNFSNNGKEHADGNGYGNGNGNGGNGQHNMAPRYGNQRPNGPGFNTPGFWRNGNSDARAHGNNNGPAPTDAVPLSSVRPGPAWPTESQLSVAHTYGIRRENGNLTPLVPADEMQRLDFSRLSINERPEGMIILPPTRQPRPENRRGNEMVDACVSQTPSHLAK